MSEQGLSILSHVSIGTDDLERALAFYNRVLPILGFRRVAEHPGAIATEDRFANFGCSGHSTAGRHR